MSSRIIIIDGISNSGKTTFCEYLCNKGYILIDEAPIFMKKNKELGSLSTIIPINLEEEIYNQNILFNVELERIKCAFYYALAGNDVIMDRSFLSTVAMAYSLENKMPFTGAYLYSKKLEMMYLEEIKVISELVDIKFVFFDVNQDVVIERNNKRKNVLSTEWIQDDFLERQRSYFLSISSVMNIDIIDTSYLSIDSIAKNIFGKSFKIKN